MAARERVRFKEQPELEAVEADEFWTSKREEFASQINSGSPAAHTLRPQYARYLETEEALQTSPINDYNSDSGISGGDPYENPYSAGVTGLDPAQWEAARAKQKFIRDQQQARWLAQKQELARQRELLQQQMHEEERLREQTEALALERARVDAEKGKLASALHQQLPAPEDSDPEVDAAAFFALYARPTTAVTSAHYGAPTAAAPVPRSHVGRAPRSAQPTRATIQPSPRVPAKQVPHARSLLPSSPTRAQPSTPYRGLASMSKQQQTPSPPIAQTFDGHSLPRASSISPTPERPPTREEPDSILSTSQSSLAELPHESLMYQIKHKLNKDPVGGVDSQQFDDLLGALDDMKQAKDVADERVQELERKLTSYEEIMHSARQRIADVTAKYEEALAANASLVSNFGAMTSRYNLSENQDEAQVPAFPSTAKPARSPTNETKHLKLLLTNSRRENEELNKALEAGQQEKIILNERMMAMQSKLFTAEQTLAESPNRVGRQRQFLGGDAASNDSQSTLKHKNEEIVGLTRKLDELEKQQLQSEVTIVETVADLRLSRDRVDVLKRENSVLREQIELLSSVAQHEATLADEQKASINAHCDKLREELDELAGQKREAAIALAAQDRTSARRRRAARQSQPATVEDINATLDSVERDFGLIDR